MIGCVTMRDWGGRRGEGYEGRGGWWGWVPAMIGCVTMRDWGGEGRGMRGGGTSDDRVCPR